MQSLIDATIKHYRIQRRLTRGGMSEIYLAEDTRTSQMVALKVVCEDAEDYRERFRREVRTIASLHHDHILPALDYGEYHSWSYLVTPYIEHGTLREHLAKGPLSLNEAGLFLEQIVSALQYAHERGILHRDIKASNVLLRDKDYVYLADFGLVKSISDEYSLTRTGFLIGTPEYLAPELIDYPATCQSDIYALGVLLYEMLTGTMPFKGSTPVAIMVKHLREQPVPPSHLNPLIPPAVDRVVLCALEKNPQQRFQSARALGDAYRRALEEEGQMQTIHAVALADVPTPRKSVALPTQAPAPLPAPLRVQGPELFPTDSYQAPTVVQQPRIMAPGPRVAPPRPLPPRRSAQRPPQRFSRPAPSRSRTPRWVLPILILSLLILLIAGSLLFSVFSALRSSSPQSPQQRTPITTPVAKP